MKPKRTAHQKEMMGLILKAAGESSLLKQNEIQPMLIYGGAVTFGAVRASNHAVEEQGMLVRVKDGRYRKLAPTQRGYDRFRPAR